MDFTFLKDNGITGWVAIAVAAALYVGQKLLDMVKAKIDQQPAMAANRLAQQQQIDATTAGQMKWMMERLTAAEHRLDQKDRDMMAMAEEMRECEHRYATLSQDHAKLSHNHALVCAALTQHGIPLPPEIIT
jgi:uncharacterized protein HemX